VESNGTHEGKYDFSQLADRAWKISSQSRGKEMVILFDGGRPMTLSLGFTGNFSWVPYGGGAPKYWRWRMVRSDGGAIYFSCKRKLSRIDPKHYSDHRSPCVWAENTEWESFIRGKLGLRKMRRPMYEVIMDQSLFNGVGNYIRAEVLQEVGGDPFMPANEYLGSNLKKLSLSLVILSSQAYALGGYQGTDWINPNGMDPGPFKAWLQCYSKMSRVKDSSGRSFWFDQKWAR